MSEATTPAAAFISSQTQVIHTTATCSVTRRNWAQNLSLDAVPTGHRGCKRCGGDALVAAAEAEAAS